MGLKKTHIPNAQHANQSAAGERLRSRSSSGQAFKIVVFMGKAPEIVSQRARHAGG